MPYQVNRCLIAKAENVCRECGGIGTVVCLVLPHTLKPLNDDDYVVADGALQTKYIQQMDDELLDAIKLPSFKSAPSRTADISYFANHCEHCGALQGDWYLHDVGAPFWPEPSAGDRPVTLELFDRSATIDASLGTVTFDLGLWEATFAGEGR